MSKFRPGQRLRGIPAHDWNQFVDAANASRASALSQSTGPLDTSDPSAVVVKVRNSTLSVWPRHTIVGVGAPQITPSANIDAFKEAIIHAAAVPTSADVGRFAITREPIQPGFVGEATLAGVSYAQIDATSDTASSQWAECAGGTSDSLVAGDLGSARILYRESGTGKKWGIVRLADPARLAQRCLVRLDAGIAGRDPTTFALSSTTALTVLSVDGSDQLWEPGSTPAVLGLPTRIYNVASLPLMKGQLVEAWRDSVTQRWFARPYYGPYFTPLLGQGDLHKPYAWVGASYYLAASDTSQTLAFGVDGGGHWFLAGPSSACEFTIGGRYRVRWEVQGLIANSTDKDIVITFTYDPPTSAYRQLNYYTANPTPFGSGYGFSASGEFFKTFAAGEELTMAISRGGAGTKPIVQGAANVTLTPMFD